MEMTEGRSGALLDCAVGPAEITAEVLRRESFDRALLCDISPTMIAKASQRLDSLLPAESISRVSFVTGDVFQILPSIVDQRFDLVFCLGLIAHTGRLEELMFDLKAVLSPSGRILLQSTLFDHWGTKVVRTCSAKRYAAKHGYTIEYFYHKEILEACKRAGLRIVERRRYCAGIPFGDRIWARANYHLERLLSPLASYFGAESLYLLERDSAA